MLKAASKKFNALKKNDKQHPDDRTGQCICVVWDPECLLSGLSPRDIVDEYYIKTFPKCRDIYCHSTDQDKIDIPVCDASRTAGAEATGLDFGGIMSNKMDLAGLAIKGHEKTRDRSMSRSIGELPPLVSSKDVSQMLSCTDAIFALKVALAAELLSKSAAVIRIKETMKTTTDDLFSSCSSILPAPYVDSLPEHIFINVWGSDLMTPLNVASRVSACYIDEGAQQQLGPMLSWKVRGDHLFVYRLQLCRFHHFLQHLFGNRLMQALFAEKVCPLVVDKRSKNKSARRRSFQAFSDTEWQKRRRLGQIRAVVSDLIDTIEFAGNVTDKNANICLMDTYLLYKSPPVSPRDGDSTAVHKAALCSCSHIRRDAVRALSEVLAVCSDHVLRHNFNSSDLVACVSVVVCQGLLCGDIEVNMAIHFKIKYPSLSFGALL